MVLAPFEAERRAFRRPLRYDFIRSALLGTEEPALTTEQLRGGRGFVPIYGDPLLESDFLSPFRPPTRFTIPGEPAEGVPGRARFVIERGQAQRDITQPLGDIVQPTGKKGYFRRELERARELIRALKAGDPSASFALNLVRGFIDPRYMRKQDLTPSELDGLLMSLPGAAIPGIGRMALMQALQMERAVLPVQIETVLRRTSEALWSQRGGPLVAETYDEAYATFKRLSKEVDEVADRARKRLKAEGRYSGVLNSDNAPEYAAARERANIADLKARVLYQQELNRELAEIEARKLASRPLTPAGAAAATPPTVPPTVGAPLPGPTAHDEIVALVRQDATIPARRHITLADLQAEARQVPTPAPTEPLVTPISRRLAAEMKLERAARGEGPTLFGGAQLAIAPPVPPGRRAAAEIRLFKAQAGLTPSGARIIPPAPATGMELARGGLTDTETLAAIRRMQTKLAGIPAGRTALGLGPGGGPPLRPTAVAAAPTLPPSSAGRTFLGDLNDIATVEKQVITSDNPIIQAIVRTTGMNPSVLHGTPVGRLLTAYFRQRVSAEELVDVATQAALDVYAQAFTARLGGVIPIDSNGVLKGTGKLWQDVFSNPPAYKLKASTRAYIEGFRKLIDEAEAIRVQHGLESRARTLPQGQFYVPRQVKTIRGVELQRPSSPKLQRIHELAQDGFDNGVRYDIDPRATAELHLRSAVREVVEKQLSDALEAYSITPKQLLAAMNPAVIARYEASIKAGVQAANRLRKLQNEMRGLQVGVEPAARAGGLPKEAEALRKVRTPRREALAHEIAQAKQDLAAARIVRDQARHQYGRAMEAARKAEVAPGSIFGRQERDISIGMWRNRYFQKEDYTALTEALGQFGASPEQTAIFKAIETIANATRFASAVGDFAAPLIQGLPVFGTDPLVWARASGLHYFAFLDPTIQAKQIRAHLATYQKMARLGIPVGDPETFAALKRGQGLSIGFIYRQLTKGPQLRETVRGVTRQIPGRFQASYNTFLGESRRMLFEALEGTMPDAELAALLRNLTGGLDSRALGVMPRQRSIESIFWAFSPRLFRSTMALVADAARPTTPRGRKALRSLLQMSAGIVGIYVASGVALGKTREEITDGLNPLNGKRFLSHEVNGDWIGVGGLVRATVQLAWKLVADPQAVAKGNLYDNPLLSFYSSRGAVGTRMVTAAIEAASKGRLDILPYDRVDSVPDLFKHLGTSALPFAVQGILEGQQAITNAVQLLGPRTSAATGGERLQTAIKQEAASRGLGEGELGRNVQEQLIAESPELAELERKAAEDRRRRGNPWQIYYDERDAIRTEGAGQIEAAASKYGLGKELRFFIDDVNTRRANDTKGLQERNSALFEGLMKKDLPEAEFDRAYALYNELLYEGEPLEDPDTGEFNFAERDKRLQAFQDAIDPVTHKPYGSAMLREVQDYVHRDELPIEADLRTTREILRPYWETEDEVVDKASQRGLLSRSLWEKYRNLHPDDQLLVRGGLAHAGFTQKQAATIAGILWAIDGSKDKRRTQPEIDLALLRWGYTTEARTPEGQAWKKAQAKTRQAERELVAP